tara:strand:+ start:1841 stop:2662 length:822 start_codon:yes stop_codon:yes gene_type:complete
MGNLKQRLIKAGRDYNYAEGVKVKATTAVYADQIVYVTASDGPYLSVATADADAYLTGNGRLMIAKHDIPANGYGVVLPWKLVTGFDTLAGAVGDPVFLSDTPGTAAASNLTLTAPSGDATHIVVGRVTVDATAGAVLVNAAAPESRVQGGAITGVAGSTVAVRTGRPVEQLVIETAASATAQDFTLDYPIIITGVAVVAKAGSAGVNVELFKGATSNAISILVATGGTINIKTFSTGIVPANCIIPAGTLIRVKKSGAGTAGDLVIIDHIRG